MISGSSGTQSPAFGVPTAAGRCQDPIFPAGSPGEGIAESHSKGFVAKLLAAI